MLKSHLGLKMPSFFPLLWMLWLLFHEVRIVFFNSLALRAVLGALMACSHSLLCIISSLEIPRGHVTEKVTVKHLTMQPLYIEHGQAHAYTKPKV